MEKATSHDGTDIAFWRSGSGPSLLLVHGTTADHQRWVTISPRLEQHFTVYAMDRRGRGASGDGSEYDLMREAEDVAAVAEAIGEPTAVLGHSYGALVSLEAALLTDKISRLLLYEPPIPTDQPLYPAGVPERMQALIDEGELEAALEIMIREVVHMPDHEFEAYRKLPMWPKRIAITPTIPREMGIELSYVFTPEKFANLTIPTLLLTGGDSPPALSVGIDILNKALPNSQVISMPGQQHIAMDTAPDLFERAIMDFMQE